MKHTTIKHGSKQVDVLYMDVSEITDLKDVKIRNEDNAPIQENLESTFGMRPGDRSERKFHLGDMHSIEDLDKRLTEGWAEGAEKALTLSEGLLEGIQAPLSIRRRIRYADDGDEFDKERLIDGHLDTCWRTTVRQIAVATPIINIATGWGGNCIMSHDKLFWSGAAALALCNVLEGSGYQTSLTCISPTRLEDWAQYNATCIEVKQAGEYMRPDALASVLCFAPTFRVYGFMGIYTGNHKTTMGLGYHIPVEDLIPAIIETGFMAVPQIVLPDSYNKNAARKTVENALAELQAANMAALPEILG